VVFREGQRVRVIRGTDSTFQPHMVGAWGTVRAAQAHVNSASCQEVDRFYLVLLDQPLGGCRLAGFWGDELELAECAVVDCSGLLEE
jgi:hypothetical protein